MRRILNVLTALALASQLVPGLASAADTPAGDQPQYPLAPSRIALHKGNLTFRAGWTGPPGATFNPQAVDSAVAIRGVGSDGAIAADRNKWKILPKGRGYRYRDHSGATGGIRSILLRMKAKGGVLKIAGHGSRFGAVPVGTVTLTLSIGTARWCAEFPGPFTRNASGMVSKSDKAPVSCPCAETTGSTWAAVQSAIIEHHGCTAAACHGGAPNAGSNGNLVLLPDVAYQNLVGVPSNRLPELERVKRADRTHSLFWLKLAMGAAPDVFADIGARLGITSTAGSPMPLGLPPLSKDELEAVRLWIQAGAPETGVVAGTDQLLSTCLPPPDPIKITPPAVPAASDGVQFYAPPWTIEPRNAAGQNGEGEVCHATYFDFSAQVPDSVRISKDDPVCKAVWGGHADCFYYNRSELTQDPNSHHSIIHIYRGSAQPGTPEWNAGFGPFTCRAGDRAGHACDPLGDASQCPGSTCAGRVQSTVACIGYGPPDYGFDITGTGSNNAPSVGGSQQPYIDQRYPAGVYGLYPVTGTMVWNSHAFNVTDRPTTNEQYFNVFFAQTPADRQDVIRGIFDARFIFVQNVPPFQKVEYCATNELPKGARLFELSSHTHKRGVLFRIWLPPNTACTPGPGCQPNTTPPLVSTTTYNDPVQYIFTDPLALDGDDAASRTIKFCSVFDNGASDPALVKRRSTSPLSPFGLAAPGGPCQDPTVACLNGPHEGELCGGDNHKCDSAPGRGDGICDACPLKGGVTTEDEMFIALGGFYCPTCPLP